MYDKNGKILQVGDYVKVTKRQIDFLNTSRVAIVKYVDKIYTTILFYNHGLPMPCVLKSSTLTLIDEKDIDDNKKILFSKISEKFDMMSEELRLI